MSNIYEQEELKLSQIANAYYSAEEAAHTGNYKEAYGLLQRASEPVSAEDQYNWGVVFLHEGKYELAFLWFSKAHEQGYLDATYALGIMYYEGKNVAEDKRKAFQLFEKIIYEPAHSYHIRSDHLGIAQFLVAHMYSEGESVEKDISLAAKWYEKSAENGNIYGRANIGSFYYHGDGVPRSYSVAWEWLKEFDIEKHISYDLEGNKTVTLNTDEYSLYSFANCPLGMMFLLGKGTEQDYKKALTCLLFSGENGDEEAQFWLSVVFELGLGTEKSIQESLAWLEKSASSGFDLALEVSSSCDKSRKLHDLWKKELAEAKRIKDTETSETEKKSAKIDDSDFQEEYYFGKPVLIPPTDKSPEMEDLVKEKTPFWQQKYFCLQFVREYQFFNSRELPTLDSEILYHILNNDIFCKKWHGEYVYDLRKYIRLTIISMKERVMNCRKRYNKFLTNIKDCLFGTSELSVSQINRLSHEIIRATPHKSQSKN